MRFGFSVIGLIIFILPMFVNIVYLMLPPKNKDNNEENNNKFLELIEHNILSKFIYKEIIVTNKNWMERI